MAPVSSTATLSPARSATPPTPPTAPISLISLPAGTLQGSVHASRPTSVVSPTLLPTASTNAAPAPATACASQTTPTQPQQATRTIWKTIARKQPCGCISIETRKSLGAWIYNMIMLALTAAGLAMVYVENSRGAWTAQKDFREDCFNQKQVFGNWSTTCHQTLSEDLSRPPLFTRSPLHRRTMEHNWCLAIPRPSIVTLAEVPIVLLVMFPAKSRCLSAPCRLYQREGSKRNRSVPALLSQAWNYSLKAAFVVVWIGYVISSPWPSYGYAAKVELASTFFSSCVAIFIPDFLSIMGRGSCAICEDMA
ncbi:uncharacterized protein PV07_10950 [Cladophialophora immunda]|uniref:Uncharacterized protein n=1 Tax=Cladophialophora immunda TaxID=569365 RepID=A0A0D1Z4Y4_9EURO|nr:uncharacterized protein PV07_10950 [Cladophialophora immunda]KIW22676.1 hypothetical protein PV07_10950 [Cladophialophora immunda]